MDAGAFAYPKLHYFRSGNPFTGSYKGLSYKIVPAEEELHITVWYGMYCSEVTEPAAATTLPLSEEGLEQSREYLWEQYLQMPSAAL